MNINKTATLLAAVLAVGFQSGGIPRIQAATPGADGLVWNVESLETTIKAGERYANFAFWFTNVSPSEIQIQSARSSCFCTVAQLPQTPWPIAPNDSGPIKVTMDLAGKSATVTKAVNVQTSAGMKTLMVKTTILPAEHGANAAMNDTDRLKNMQTALADRQAVFTKVECAACHADPAKGKTDGAELYAAVCHSCHDSPHRASSVPDLRALKHPTDSEHWKKWITYGRAGSMMPAFARSEGGPLDDQQIAALVNHLAKTIPSGGASSSSGFQVNPERRPSPPSGQ